MDNKVTITLSTEDTKILEGVIDSLYEFHRSVMKVEDHIAGYSGPNEVRDAIWHLLDQLQQANE